MGAETCGSGLSTVAGNKNKKHYENTYTYSHDSR